MLQYPTSAHNKRTPYNTLISETIITIRNDLSTIYKIQNPDGMQSISKFWLEGSKFSNKANVKGNAKENIWRASNKPFPVLEDNGSSYNRLSHDRKWLNVNHPWKQHRAILTLTPTAHTTECKNICAKDEKYFLSPRRQSLPERRSSFCIGPSNKSVQTASLMRTPSRNVLLNAAEIGSKKKLWTFLQS